MNEQDQISHSRLVRALTSRDCTEIRMGDWVVSLEREDKPATRWYLRNGNDRNDRIVRSGVIGESARNTAREIERSIVECMLTSTTEGEHKNCPYCGHAPRTAHAGKLVCARGHMHDSSVNRSEAAPGPC